MFNSIFKGVIFPGFLEERRKIAEATRKKQE